MLTTARKIETKTLFVKGFYQNSQTFSSGTWDSNPHSSQNIALNDACLPFPPEPEIVAENGLEPLTNGLWFRCSTYWATPHRWWRFWTISLRSFIAGTSSCATSNFSSCNTLQPQVRKHLACFNPSLALLREEHQWPFKWRRFSLNTEQGSRPPTSHVRLDMIDLIDGVRLARAKTLS